MATVGPELPPHLLAKRKRQQEEAEDDTSKPQPRSRSSSQTSSTISDSKRRKTIGPAPPPAPLSERPASPPSPQNPNQSNSDSDDDDFGPSLPPTGARNESSQHSENLGSHPPQETLSKPQTREEWMLIPPSNSDWSSRIDPTKLRNRKFNTGKGSKAPSTKGAGTGNVTSAIWTETPEQKRQRLHDEMMGVKKPAQLVTGAEEDDNRARRREDEAERRETERRIQDFNERNRGMGSLYEEHKKGVKKEKEDDPSKRAFDKEKDMGGGMKIGHAKRKEMVGRAADFGSRFAGGKYL
ncbi:MAG: hypothetical protein L6R40_004403 [Gallowayella cf. fulva]|nr:MAG: hypothetical protein L6R40_004403 [Xanthomendoza cf. fulva]